MSVTIAQTVIDEVAAWIVGSRRVVVLTGAGVSRESGIPTFRERGTGIWAKVDPMAVASVQGFVADPVRAWGWHESLRAQSAATTPNAGHVALAELEAFVPHVVIVTQNIDGLHQRAGSQDVLPIHGSLARNRCFFDCQGDGTYLAADEIDFDTPDGVPRCAHCGRWARPDVVWFGEMLPEALIERATQESLRADLMLVVGTSGEVQPAASLPFWARNNGARIVEVNPQPGGITPIADRWLAGPSAEVLPRVVAAVRQLWESAASTEGMAAADG